MDAGKAHRGGGAVKFRFTAYYADDECESFVFGINDLDPFQEDDGLFRKRGLPHWVVDWARSVLDTVQGIGNDYRLFPVSLTVKWQTGQTYTYSIAPERGDSC